MERIKGIGIGLMTNNLMAGGEIPNIIILGNDLKEKVMDVGNSPKDNQIVIQEDDLT